MFNEDIAKIHEMKSGNLGIETPYNVAFVKELKSLVPSARWSSPYWVIKPSGEEQAKGLLAEYYPPKEALQRVRIEWDLDHGAPQIDGVNLASVSRDYWSWRKDCPIDFKIVESTVDCGGSRKYPGLFGRLVIETTIRTDANISPAAAVTIIENGEVSSPLAAFSTEELLAELQARGIK